jgi:hypothetical protein
MNATRTAGTHKSVDSAVTGRSLADKVLLTCGILYLPVYLASHLLAGMQLEGYSHLDQQVSELSAIGSPARPLLTVFGLLITVLVIAFGIGVWQAAGQKRSLRITAIALLVFGAIGFLGGSAPMNPPGAERSATDIAHLIFIFFTVLSMFVFVGFGSGVDGKWFRIYSFLTILAALVAGVWVSMHASQIGAGVITPGLGAIERVSVYGPLLWMMVFAVVLLHAEPEQTEI